ncbi:MAG: helix-turn-helix domain-containing protein [Clostridia bacterium]|nr:helix-turn-helix domain-containing protein [Clostridia bacterium]
MDMDCERELRLLCDTFRKCHVPATVLSLADTVGVAASSHFQFLSPDFLDGDRTVRQCLGDLAPKTVYKVCDGLDRCYIYLLLPDGKDSTLLLLGPYLSVEPTPARILELTENLGIPPKSQRYFNEYYTAIPVISAGSRLFVLLDTFCESLWNSPSFAIVDVDREYRVPVSPINETARNDNFDEILVNMKTMEARYEFENELMRAVSLGQLHKENQLLADFPEQAFEKRAADPLRNAKNYCVIMNTLLRKAAEDGGVHPVYLNNISSEFALKIEQMASLSGHIALMREIFRSYCRLVRKHSMKSYSLLVQKTVLLIDSDLSANLTLHTLAKHQNVSEGYLATVFKRDTGKTVSQYIREKRVKHASYLLATTHLQVQTVALHCGIVDVQYFSKIFKKETGKTPKEYRESVKKSETK